MVDFTPGQSPIEVAPKRGDLLDFRLPDKVGRERWRPAMVVNVGTAGQMVLTVFLDAINDLDLDPMFLQQYGVMIVGPGIAVAGSPQEGTKVGKWRRLT